MGELAGSRAELFHGLPAYRLSLPQGDSALVLLHGAHVVSWIANGRERLYLSPHSKLDGKSAIRGGIPVCFPQFNQRGPLPKHGFARTLSWQVGGAPVLTRQSASLVLRLSADATTRAVWAQHFETRLMVELQPGKLRVTLEVRNLGEAPLQFTGALHSYLAVRHISKVEIRGLEGQPEWDALRDVHGRVSGVLRFHDEFDRVYEAGPQPVVLREGEDQLLIAQSPSWAHTVVWNPGAEKCAGLPDLPSDGYEHMVCVEAAQVMLPIEVHGGSVWAGWQSLSLS